MHANVFGQTWLYRYSQTTSSYEHALAMSESNDNGYVMGVYRGQSPGAIAWIIKLDNTAQIVWQKEINGVREISSIVKNSYGYIVSGKVITETYGDLWVAQIDEDGNLGHRILEHGRNKFSRNSLFPIQRQEHPMEATFLPVPPG